MSFPDFVTFYIICELIFSVALPTVTGLILVLASYLIGGTGLIGREIMQRVWGAKGD